MLLNYDVDLQKFIVGPNSTQEVMSISAKRSPNFPLQIRFFNSNNPTPIELPSGTTGTFEIKRVGEYDSNALTMASFWTKTGSGATTLYTFDLDLQNAALDALVGAQDPTQITSLDATANTFTKAGHGLANGNVVQLTTDDTLPPEFSLLTDYYVVNVTSNTFQLSLTAGGSVIDFATTGTGPHYFSRIDNDEASVNLMCAMQYIAGGRTNESPTLTFVYINDVCREDDTGSTPAPEDIVLNARVGVEAITNGVDFQDIDFDTPFDMGAVPAVVGNLAIPDEDAAPIDSVIQQDEVDENGFRVRFLATIPAAGYKFHYHAIQT